MRRTMLSPPWLTRVVLPRVLAVGSVPAVGYGMTSLSKVAGNRFRQICKVAGMYRGIATTGITHDVTASDTA